MKMKRWIALLLIAAMTLMMVCSCKTKTGNEDDEATIGEFVEQEETDNGDINSKPGSSSDDDDDNGTDGTDDTDNGTDDTHYGTDDTDNGTDDTDSGSDDTDNGTDDTDDGSDDTDSGSDDPAPVEKESSGTAVTIMVQNLKTTGNQKGIQGEREDTLGRKGQANESYQRMRRFRENVKRVDPDVILTCEGTPAWLDWLQNETYFKTTYTCLYHYRSPEGAEIDQGTPLLFKTDKYELVDSGHFWHSATPDKEYSLCFDIEDRRVCTWAKLRDKSTGAEFYAYTCHINNNSNSGGTNGLQTMELYQEVLSKLPEGSYAFVGGDYNISYRDAVYAMSMDWDRMIDLKDMALNMQEDGLTEIGGNNGSVNQDYEKDKYGGLYGTPPIVDNPGNTQMIDHLMAKPSANMAVDFWGYDYTTTALEEEGVVEGYVSDHYALVVKVRIDTKADYSQYQVEH